jgi:hypothetical protein
MDDQTMSAPCVLSDDIRGRRASGTTAQQDDGVKTMNLPHTATADGMRSQNLLTGFGDHHDEPSQIGTSTVTEPSNPAKEAPVRLTADCLSEDDSRLCSADEEVPSDHEREAEISHTLAGELLQYHAEPLKLKRQREAGRKRGLQASQFLLAIENRVRELEHEVKRLQKTRDEKIEDTEVAVDVEADIPPEKISDGFLLKPARLAWSDFSLPSHLRALKDQSTIDFLIEKPHSFGQKASPFGVLDDKPPSLPGSQSHRRRRQSGLGQGSSPVERVRFNSLHLEQIFEDILGGDTRLHVPGTFHQLRPFKAIIPYTNELSAKLLEMEQLIAKRDEMATNWTDGDKTFQATSGGRPSTDVKPDKPDSTSDKDAFEQLQLDISRHDLVAMRDHTKALVECFETTLFAEISSYTQLRSRSMVDGQSIKVSFTDLWYLFAPGDLVYDHTNGQAMRVLSVRGGRPHLVDEVSLPPPQRYDTVFDPSLGQYVETGRPQRLKATDMQADFALTCFYLSFNGTHFGPVQRDIAIDPFEGSTAVDSLVVIPIEYVKESAFRSTQVRSGQAPGTQQSLHDVLLARGRLYADLARPGEAGMLLSYRLRTAYHVLTANSSV